MYSMMPASLLIFIASLCRINHPKEFLRVFKVHFSLLSERICFNSDFPMLKAKIQFFPPRNCQTQQHMCKGQVRIQSHLCCRHVPCCTTWAECSVGNYWAASQKAIHNEWNSEIPGFQAVIRGNLYQCCIYWHDPVCLNGTSIHVISSEIGISIVIACYGVPPILWYGGDFSINFKKNY